MPVRKPAATVPKNAVPSKWSDFSEYTRNEVYRWLHTKARYEHEAASAWLESPYGEGEGTQHALFAFALAHAEKALRDLAKKGK